MEREGFEMVRVERKRLYYGNTPALISELKHMEPEVWSSVTTPLLPECHNKMQKV